MQLIQNQKSILIVGLGLIGGSYAQALKKLGFRVIAIDMRQEAIDYAISHSFIDEGYSHNDPKAIESADILVFALYPTVFVNWIKENQQHLKSGAILTDVTGVKSCLVYEIQSMLRPDVEFIAAHPMAGKEVSGVENSDPSIFRGANYIVVPTEKNTQDAIELCEEIGRLLGFAKVSILSPEKHDEMIGFLSQLTHAIAVSLMTCSDNESLVDYTGDSFRDLTRIARINDAMWSELFLLNKDCLLEQMDLFIKEFSDLRQALVENDSEKIRQKMRLSTARRALFNKK